MSVWDVRPSSEPPLQSKVLRSAEDQCCSTQYVSQLFIIGQISPRNNLKEEMFIMGHGIRGCSPGSAGSMASGCGPVKHYDKRAWWSKAVYHTAARKQREGRKGAGPRHNLQRCASVVYFLWFSPVLHNFPTSKYDIQILNASVDQTNDLTTAIMIKFFLRNILKGTQAFANLLCISQYN